VSCVKTTELIEMQSGWCRENVLCGYITVVWCQDVSITEDFQKLQIFVG